MEKKNIDLMILHDQIDSDMCNLIEILEEIDVLYPEDPLPEYTLLLYQYYISLSELSYLIKEYFALKNIMIHKF